MNGYLKRILNARVYDVAIESPLEFAPNLSARIGNTVLLKREDMQPVFSFKLRGAYNKMAQLTPEQLKRGVIAASAGNHAQGVALSAQKLGCKAVIVMPTTTPQIKIQAVAGRGAKVVLHGDSYSDAYQHALELEQQSRMTFVHPFDDPDVIAGQGTIGMEILRQHPDPIYAIFCCVGGGGLIAGVAAYVKRVGEETFRLCQQYVDEMVLVDTDAICAAIKDVFEDTRSILEPAGALAVAGAKAYVERSGVRNQKLVAVASGANTNFDRLRFVAERAEVGEHREAILAVTIPERPGSMKKFCALLGARSVTEFNYRMAHSVQAHIFVGVEVHD